MRITVIIIVLSLFGCSTNTSSTGSSGTKPQAKQRDFTIVITKDDQTYYFDNRHPHCLAYRLRGEWIHALQEAALVTPDRQHFVGVILFDKKSGESDASEVSRIISLIRKDTEKDWGPVQSKVTPFPANRPGAAMLEFENVVVTPEAAARALGDVKPKVGQTAAIPTKVVAPLVPGVMMVVTVGHADDARQVLDTIEVTENPRCWEQTIRERFPGLIR